MFNNLVTTIIPVYNRPKMLQEAIASVINQTYRPIEIVIVDDGSTDETYAVADNLAKNYPKLVKTIHKDNEGPGLAREAGRRIAQGEFIQYLDSDDLLLPNKFDIQVKGLRDNPDCGVSYGKTRYRNTDGTYSPEPIKGTGQKVDTMFPLFLKYRWWSTSTPLFRSDLYKKVGGWTDLRLEEDWEHDCRIASLNIKLHYCNEFVSETRDHDENRLSRGCTFDPLRLRERARAHSLILHHALRAGITESYIEMQHFARELFLLSRQCGAAGLTNESRKLFHLSQMASTQVRAKGWDFKLYRLGTYIIGWGALGKIACAIDRFRS